MSTKREKDRKLLKTQVLFKNNWSLNRMVLSAQITLQLNQKNATLEDR